MIKKKLPPPASYARVYYDPAHVAGYGTSSALAASVEGSTPRHAAAWLSGQDTHTLHRSSRKRFDHEQIFVNGLDHQWSCDLISLVGLAPMNSGFKYLLTIIDALSKYAWVRPLKDKTNDSVIKAFRSVFAQGRKPRLLRFDRGSEFMGRKFIAFLKTQKIVHFTADHLTKEAIVERFNRTLQSRMWKYFSATNRQRYLDALPSFVEAYNNRIHSSIGMKPSSVTPYNAEDAWRQLYGHMLGGKRRQRPRPPKPLFKEGDLVRISKIKKHFEQAYKTNWSRELFKVSKTIPARVTRYTLTDLAGEDIVGTFQNFELQRVKSATKTVRRVIRRTKEGRDVQWRGYPDTLITLIPTP